LHPLTWAGEGREVAGAPEAQAMVSTMTSQDLARIFPGLVDSYLEEATAPQQVSPDPIHEAHPSWSFTTTEQVLTVGAIFHDSGQLRVTLGLALDVPYAAEVSHVVNRLNNKYLLFGRMFLIGNDESGRGCVLMQEIFLCDSLSEEYAPSIQNLIQVMAALGGQASQLAPQIREQFGGRPFTDADAFFLQTSG
jgi:hypothetical protein